MSGTARSNITPCSSGVCSGTVCAAALSFTVGPRVENLTTSAADIVWSTDLSSTGTVYYSESRVVIDGLAAPSATGGGGGGAAYSDLLSAKYYMAAGPSTGGGSSGAGTGYQTRVSSTSAANHRITLTGLSPSPPSPDPVRTYYYMVRATGSSGQIEESGTLSFDMPRLSDPCGNRQPDAGEECDDGGRLPATRSEPCPGTPEQQQWTCSACRWVGPTPATCPEAHECESGQTQTEQCQNNPTVSRSRACQADFKWGQWDRECPPLDPACSDPFKYWQCTDASGQIIWGTCGDGGTQTPICQGKRPDCPDNPSFTNPQTSGVTQECPPERCRSDAAFMWSCTGMPDACPDSASITATGCIVNSANHCDRLPANERPGYPTEVCTPDRCYYDSEWAWQCQDWALCTADGCQTRACRPHESGPNCGPARTQNPHEGRPSDGNVTDNTQGRLRIAEPPGSGCSTCGASPNTSYPTQGHPDAYLDVSPVDTCVQRSCVPGARRQGYMCKKATCGDGYLQTGLEQCDEGPLNGQRCNPRYGSSCTYCSKACRVVSVPGGFCGDKIVQTEAGELCDGPVGGPNLSQYWNRDWTQVCVSQKKQDQGDNATSAIPINASLGKISGRQTGFPTCSSDCRTLECPQGSQVCQNAARCDQNSDCPTGRSCHATQKVCVLSGAGDDNVDGRVKLVPVFFASDAASQTDQGSPTWKDVFGFDQPSVLLNACDPDADGDGVPKPDVPDWDDDPDDLNPGIGQPIG